MLQNKFDWRSETNRAVQPKKMARWVENTDLENKGLPHSWSARLFSHIQETGCLIIRLMSKRRDLSPLIRNAMVSVISMRRVVKGDFCYLRGMLRRRYIYIEQVWKSCLNMGVWPGKTKFKTFSTRHLGKVLKFLKHRKKLEAFYSQSVNWNEAD